MALPLPRNGRLTPVTAAAAAGLVVTLVVAAVPGVRFAYESLELHVALEASQGVVALLLAYLAFGRLRLTWQLPDLVLTLAFAAFAAANLFVSALPVALEGETVGFSTWTAAGLRLVAAATLAAAAFAPVRGVARDGLAGRTVAASLAVVGAVLLLAAVADSTLARLIDPGLSPEASSRPLISGHGAAVAVQLGSMALTAAAAVAFAMRAARTGDDFMRWLAAGATLGAFARLNYVLFPSLYTEWFYTGDLLRFGSYLLFLTGAAREIGSYWRRQAELAVLDERRRVARDLHDGLTQELSFIRSQVATTSGKGIRPEMLPFVAEAAQRALTESRKIIEAFTGVGEGPLDTALRQAAEAVASRAGVAVAVRADSVATADREAREALQRIVGEAVTNAVRHGGATSVVIRIAALDSKVVVRVEDDGRGFDPAALDGHGGFGLTSMRERAERLGGTFLVKSVPGQGTAVEVVVPAG